MGQIESLRQGMSDISAGLKEAVDADDRERILTIAEDLANLAANGAPDIPFPTFPDPSPQPVPVPVPDEPPPATGPDPETHGQVFEPLPEP